MHVAHQYAFIWDSLSLEYAASQEPCVTEMVGRIFNQFGYALALRKHSPLTELFSYEILNLRQDGHMDQYYKKWFSGQCTLVEGEFR